MNTISKHFTVTIAESLQLFHLEGHIFYPVSFPYKGELALLGEGQKEEINSLYPGNCSCYYKRPREPIISGCVKLCPRSAGCVEPP